MNRILYFWSMVVCLYACSSDNGSPLPDEPLEVEITGAYTEENQWVYSQMNYAYLWREDMPDSLDCDYTTDPVTFYKSLLSPKDRFSYSIRNTSYTGERQASTEGFAFQKYRWQGENILHVLYVQNPLLKNRIQRGNWLRRISGTNGYTVYERKSLMEHGFEVQDTLVLSQSSSQTSNTVYVDSIYQCEDKKVGYLCYLEFDAIADLVVPLKRFYDADIDELILDLRYNPGGYVRTCKYLCNSIVSKSAYRSVFQQCTYNDRLTRELEEKTGSGIDKEYYAMPSNVQAPSLGNPLYGLDLQRVVVLTSKYSASASEATIMCLRPYMDVIIIGEQTYGKGVGSWTISDDRYKYALQPITLRYYNANMETTPDDGIPVDVFIPGGYETVKKELGDTDEPLLAAALEYLSENHATVSPARSVSGVSVMNMEPVGEPSFFYHVVESN